ncbi:flagellar M-ring protein FliF [Paenibacillus darwinianus]|uniref:Flagellar M-ring protein n=1 Tax=Paenibacillus darwinianus TaxID=1380763 RepID=A0A9W5S278_9BACL|nr:flagellar basal-body MS-ring/collar protein FliF [Paenibacillus darwinianus]EXX91382.1 flagellar M-ring protein FliF [Paenibacillus darwinianus]EXX92288.1 flagellar M-ring protein FliF [Paenibacillus darwinianus]EXX92860.1 flagellar M-ring protein FliF [Paenibacillus darwinianus]
MNEKYAQYRDRVVQYWLNFSRNQKIMLVSAFLGLILVVILLIYMFSRTQYEVAFQNLDATDSAAIMAYLDGSGIPYKLEAGGSSISVPVADATKVKVEVGSQGMVRNGSIGFDSFDSGASQFGMTDSEFDVRYRNALNGEIQQLLNGMQGVQRSNVLINLPQESVFINPGEKEQASASITMSFVPGFRPTQEQVDGYYNLVKTAVPNLAVADITISSQEGELVASSKVNGGSALASSVVDEQFQIQRKYEGELKRNIQSFLGTMVGMDNLVINVTSTMNFDQMVSKENLVSPIDNNNNEGVKISEQVNNQTSTGTSGAAGGVTGTGETDVPGYQAVDGANSSSSESASRTTNWDVNRIQRDIVSSPYVVKDLMIGIGVQEGALPEANRQVVMDFLTELVRGQLVQSGQNVADNVLIARKVQIITQPFVQPAATGATGGIPLGWGIGIGAAALALGGAAVFVLMRRRKQAVLAAEEELMQSAKVELPTIDLDQVTTESQVRKQLEQLAKKKPEEFVNLLRTWLVDE